MKKSVKEKTIVQEQEKKPEQACHHYWVIDVANGPSSLGKCKICGEKREFMNAYPSFNPLRKNTNPLHLPRIPEVELDKDSKS